MLSLVRLRNLVRSNNRFVAQRFLTATGEGGGSAAPPQLSVLKSMYERAHTKKTEEDSAKIVAAEAEESPEDAEIHPDWLAMERRVKSRKPKPRTADFTGGRTQRRGSAWDGENV